MAAAYTNEYNVAIGYQNAYGQSDSSSHRTAHRNVAIGYQTMYKKMPGQKNIAIGDETMYDGNADWGSGDDREGYVNQHNIALGARTMYYIGGYKTSSHNTYLNYEDWSGAYIGRMFNIALGYEAGMGTSSYDNCDSFGVYIGYKAGLSLIHI